MNRSIAAVGIAVILVGIGLVAFPIVVTGAERLDPEQIAGFLVAPVGLFVVLIGAVAIDPRRTTIRGAFGNPEEPPSTSAEGSPRPRTLVNPHQPVRCRHCANVVLAELARCPRCSHARACRVCGRPLGLVLERPTCPTCGRAEWFCACPDIAPYLPSPAGRALRNIGR